jgi:SAM-dependent methyltransferase
MTIATWRERAGPATGDGARDVKQARAPANRERWTDTAQAGRMDAEGSAIMHGSRNADGNYRAQWVVEHFDRLGMAEWERWDRTTVDTVSFHLHAHYLRRYVQPGDLVLEVGAGPGRFTQVMAGLGARLVVADISPRQLDLNRQQARHLGFADAVLSWERLDVCDMSGHADGAFDGVVAYGGVLSYVLDRREQALGECCRVLRRGGVLLVSVMSIWGSAHRRLDGVLGIPSAANQGITATGDLTPASVGEGGHYCHMYRASELTGLLQSVGLEVTDVSASGCLAVGWDEFLGSIGGDRAKWGELLRMELEASAETGCRDMGTHLIAAAVKA